MAINFLGLKNLFLGIIGRIRQAEESVTEVKERVRVVEQALPNKASLEEGKVPATQLPGNLATKDLFVSTEEPVDSVGEDGDIWFVVEPTSP